MKEIKYDKYYWQNNLVRLRPWSEDDWEWDYINGFDSVGCRLADCKIEYPPTVSASKEFSVQIADCKNMYSRTYFAIETLEGIHVGRINILQDDFINGTFEIATKIASEHRGKGYGSSAMQILLKFGFIEKRLNKYVGSVIEGNEGSIKMHEKLGCKQEGVLRQSIYTNGKYCDEIMFGLLKEEYLKMPYASI